MAAAVDFCLSLQHRLQCRSEKLRSQLSAAQHEIAFAQQTFDDLQAQLTAETAHLQLAVFAARLQRHGRVRDAQIVQERFGEVLPLVGTLQDATMAKRLVERLDHALRLSRENYELAMRQCGVLQPLLAAIVVTQAVVRYRLLQLQQRGGEEDAQQQDTQDMRHHHHFQEDNDKNKRREKAQQQQQLQQCDDQEETQSVREVECTGRNE